MDSCNTTGGMEYSSGGEDEEHTSHPPAAAAAPTANIFPFFVNSNSGLRPFLHNHDHNPPLPVFKALPNSFDKINRPGSMDQGQLFELGTAVSGDELGVMLTPPAPQMPGNLGYLPCESKTSGGLMGSLSNLGVPPVSNPPKMLDECRERRSNNGVPPARRNPKKRTRASRRAPTTVLTTDTSNFLSMVQEFTGMPAPPFAAKTSAFQTAWLDLFGKNFASRTTTLGSSRLHSPSYLLRPFAQRLFQTDPTPTTLFVPATTSSNNTAISTSTELVSHF